MDRPSPAPASSGSPRTGSAHRPPSGRQYVIGHGAERLVVTEVGGGIRSYTVDDEPVLDGYDVDALCSGGRGQVLAPWPNRLGDGRYRFGDRACRAALDEPDRGNAIHGLVRWLPWEVRAQAQNVLSVGCVLQPQPGYRWRLDVEVEYRLGRGGLVVSAEATNVDDEPAPFGIGFHPYLTVGTPTVDSARLQLSAGYVVRTDDRGLPVGTAPVAGSE
ncbi:MAG TPA: hypothetical protein VE991_02200, partial [Acidimicrobiales bacterium]|nr:hypothetical protein [Acidimicrobiales bacterium]